MARSDEELYHEAMKDFENSERILNSSKFKNHRGEFDRKPRTIWEKTINFVDDFFMRLEERCE